MHRLDVCIGTMLCQGPVSADWYPKLCQKPLVSLNFFLPILLVRVWMKKVGLRSRSGERTEKKQKQITERQFKERKFTLEAVLSAC